jgi:hypothetical protein
MGFGQILYFGGDEHDPDRSARHQFDATRLFDCGSLAVGRAPSPPFDAFCCGHAFVGAANEVKLLIAGGTEQFNEEAAGLHHPHFPGLRDAAIFSTPNFATPSGGGWSWSTVAQLNAGLLASPSQVPNPNPSLTGGRWYPTLLTLPNGDVIAVSGHPGSSDISHSNDIPEVFSRNPEPRGQWRRLAQYSNTSARQYYEHYAMAFYPRLHLLTWGDIICTNPIREETVSLLPDVGPFGGSFSRITMFPGSAMQDYGSYTSTSVLLPLSRREPRRARVMVCGGTSETPFMLDLKGWSPSQSGSAGWAWRPTGARQTRQRRVNANATILPTGEILVTGGIDSGRDEPTLDARGVLEPEIYDPYADRWTLLHDPAPSVRNYHSVALLMPDGRVWCAGSDRDAGRGPSARNLDIDIYEPWYHGDPGRPFIKAAPSLAYPGETIYLESTFASEVERVVLVRCGSCTHAFNPDQRLVELEFRFVTGDVILATMPPDNFIAPAGPYLIYTIRHKPATLGLPSYGTDIYIVPEHGPERHQPRGGQDG